MEHSIDILEYGVILDELGNEIGGYQNVGKTSGINEKEAQELMRLADNLIYAQPEDKTQPVWRVGSFGARKAFFLIFQERYKRPKGRVYVYLMGEDDFYDLLQNLRVVVEQAPEALFRKPVLSQQIYLKNSGWRTFLGAASDPVEPPASEQQALLVGALDSFDDATISKVFLVTELENQLEAFAWLINKLPFQLSAKLLAVGSICSRSQSNGSCLCFMTPDSYYDINEKSGGEAADISKYFDWEEKYNPHEHAKPRAELAKKLLQYSEEEWEWSRQNLGKDGSWKDFCEKLEEAKAQIAQEKKKRSSAFSWTYSRLDDAAEASRPIGPGGISSERCWPADASRSYLKTLRPPQSQQQGHEGLDLTENRYVPKALEYEDDPPGGQDQPWRTSKAKQKAAGKTKRLRLKKPNPETLEKLRTFIYFAGQILCFFGFLALLLSILVIKLGDYVVTIYCTEGSPLTLILAALIGYLYCWFSTKRKHFFYGRRKSVKRKEHRE